MENMFTFNFQLDGSQLKVSPELSESLKTDAVQNATAFENLLKVMMPKGMPSRDSRTMARILLKMDQASINKSMEIELHISEVELLQKIFADENVFIHPDFWRSFLQFEEKVKYLKDNG